MTNHMQTQVLIVGAGPTGLTLAAELARYGIAVKIIDKNAGPSVQSKALGVQAGTLEAMENSFGELLVREMLSAGYAARGGFFHFEGKAPAWIDISKIPSRFNFILILAQNETERILEKHLKQSRVLVQRKSVLLSLMETMDGVTSTVLREDGSVETVDSQFVIGCDGAHSDVRTQLGIPFKGGTYEGDFILGDVNLEWPWEYGTLRVFVGEQGVMACFPMSGNRKYRLIIFNRNSEKHEDAEISDQELITVALSHAPKPIQISTVYWASRFRVHHRMVESFQKGRVFLAGDAAHIHSPVGGQGMNTGIQDSLNLAHKLMQVIKQHKPLSILKDYEKERLPVARQVLRLTHVPFKFVLHQPSTWTRLVWTLLLPKMIRSKFLQERLLRAVSEVDVARREIESRTINHPYSDTPPDTEVS